MNGLRLIWIISRHFKKKERMKNLIETITQEITIKVQNHIKIDELLTQKEGVQFWKQLEEAKMKIS
jgi:dynein heavy chain